MVSTNKTGKRKRHYIETYNDLNDGEQIIANGEKQDDEEEEEWVMTNFFTIQVELQHLIKR